MRTLKILSNFPLVSHNSFGIKAFAERFVSVPALEALQEAIALPGPKRILGGGSNVLLSGDVPGLVVHNALKGIEITGETPGGGVLVRAAAGENWHDLVLWALDQSLAGIENLSLIPGTVGAAPIQNIGAYGVELREVFHELEAVHLETGEHHRFDAAACRFGYRDSVFKNTLRGQYAIVSVTLALQRTPTFKVQYGDIRQMLSDMEVNELSIRAVSEAVCRIRQSKLPDPALMGNAGSFFKNPEISAAAFGALVERFPLAPSYPTPTGMKVPAGWLIEQCGWKGKRLGNAGCHERQALVLVNLGDAKGSEVLALAEQIQQSVLEKFGVALEREVNVW